MSFSGGYFYPLTANSTQKHRNKPVNALLCYIFFELLFVQLDGIVLTIVSNA